MFKNTFNLCSHIELNTQNPNPILKIRIYCTKQTKHATIHQSFKIFRKIRNISKIKLLFCILYKLHNQYFVIFVFFIIFVNFGIFGFDDSAQVDDSVQIDDSIQFDDSMQFDDLIQFNSTSRQALRERDCTRSQRAALRTCRIELCRKIESNR